MAVGINNLKTDINAPSNATINGKDVFGNGDSFNNAPSNATINGKDVFGNKISDQNPTPPTVSNNSVKTTTVSNNPVKTSAQVTPEQKSTPPVDFYRDENGTYWSLAGQRIPDLTTLGNYAKAGGKEVSNPNNKESGSQSNIDNSNNNGEKKEKDYTSEIDSALSSGYYSVDDIASSLGIDSKTVNDAISNDENLNYKLNLNKNQNQIDQAFTDYKAKTDSILNGTFELSDDEKSLLSSVQKSFDEMKTEQLKANQDYEGVIRSGEIRSGRQEFMNQISQGNYKQAIDDGIKKISDIDQKAAKTLSDLRISMEDKDYEKINDLYKNLSTYLKDKTTAINDLHKATQDAQKAQQDAIKSDLENTKLNQDIANTTISGLTPSLLEADDQTISEIADYYGIDPILLKSSVEKQINSTDSDMATKGYSIINPIDASRLKKDGYDVQVINGRAYAKEPELKAYTNKGNIAFYKGTKQVGSSSLPGGGENKMDLSTSAGKKAAVADIESYFQSVKGSDGKISPVDYNDFLAEWIKQGGTKKEFVDTFADWRDQYNTFYQ